MVTFPNASETVPAPFEVRVRATPTDKVPCGSCMFRHLCTESLACFDVCKDFLAKHKTGGIAAYGCEISKFVKDEPHKCYVHTTSTVRYIIGTLLFVSAVAYPVIRKCRLRLLVLAGACWPALLATRAKRETATTVGCADARCRLPRATEEMRSKTASSIQHATQLSPLLAMETGCARPCFVLRVLLHPATPVHVPHANLVFWGFSGITCS